MYIWSYRLVDGKGIIRPAKNLAPAMRYYYYIYYSQRLFSGRPLGPTLTRNIVWKDRPVSKNWKYSSSDGGSSNVSSLDFVIFFHEPVQNK